MHTDKSNKSAHSLMTVEDAIELVAKTGLKVTDQTIRDWCRKHELGHQLGGKGGRWVVYKEKFEEFLWQGQQEKETSPHK